MKQTIFAITLFFFGLNAHAALSGKIDSGLIYRIEQKECETIQIELSVDIGFSYENEIEQGIVQLLAYAILQETETFTQIDIQNLLKDCLQDISAGSHIFIDSGKTNFLFSIPAKNDLLVRMLGYIKQVSQHATLSQNALELARDEFIDLLMTKATDDLKDQIMSFVQILLFFTPSQLSEIYYSCYSPQNMQLVINGPLDEAAVEEVIADIFGPIDERTVEIQKPLAVKQSIETSENTVVIDGKITMNRPSWYQTSFWGTMITIACGVIAAGCFWAGCFFPPVIALAFIPIAGAVYFGVDPYLSDPAVIEAKRAEDLEKGFRHSYLKQRASLTLTPFERRNLFIFENSSGADPFPEEFKDFAISDLADIYRLTDQVFQEMFYEPELSGLATLKQEFILERNDVKGAKKALDQELNFYLESHQILRDLKLDDARARYDSHPAVVLMHQFTDEWSDVIANLSRDFENKIINQEELKILIEEANAYYEELLSDTELLIGVQEAKELLDDEQAQILSEYEEAVTIVKTTINYDQRMALVEAGKWALYAHFNNELINYVYMMPMNDPSFADTLDLR